MTPNQTDKRPKVFWEGWEWVIQKGIEDARLRPVSLAVSLTSPASQLQIEVCYYRPFDKPGKILPQCVSDPSGRSTVSPGKRTVTDGISSPAYI